MWTKIKITKLKRDGIEKKYSILINCFKKSFQILKDEIKKSI
jgi:hypothetical protein